VKLEWRHAVTYSVDARNRYPGLIKFEGCCFALWGVFAKIVSDDFQYFTTARTMPFVAFRRQMKIHLAALWWDNMPEIG
jgi:hypothetical protein